MGYSPQLLSWYLVTVLISALAMKLSSLKTARFKADFMSFVFLSPVFSTVTWNKKTAADRAIVIHRLTRVSLLSLPFAASWWLYWNLVPQLHPNVVIQCYLALIPLYCLGQFASAIFEIAYLPTGWLFPAHFQFPPLSKNLSEFWGLRWATWVADWLRQMILHPNRRRPVLGLFVAFLISGLWHELIVNVPLYLFYRVNIMGSMMIYFSFQALAIVVERKLPIRSCLLRRLYLWAVVLIPAPLVMNEGVLRAVGLFIP